MYQVNHVISLVNHVFIKGDLTVILLIDIQVLHQALMQKVFKVSGVKKSVFQNDKIQVSCTKNKIYQSICCCIYCM